MKTHTWVKRLSRCVVCARDCTRSVNDWRQRDREETRSVPELLADSLKIEARHVEALRARTSRMQATSRCCNSLLVCMRNAGI